MIYKHFDEYEIGETHMSRARTVTETDVVNYCYLTGNWLQIHSDAEFAKNSMIGERLVQGALVYSLIPGLFDISPAGLIVASYGIDKIRYLVPVRINDTIHAEAETIDKQDKGEKGGVITQKFKVMNQKEEMVQVSDWKFLVSKSK